MQMNGRVVVVSGGTQGLGKEIACTFARADAEGIVITGRNRTNGMKAVDEIEQLGSKALFLETDLTREEDCRSIIPKTLERFGAVHGLVNAAGTTLRGSIEDISLADWDYTFALNVRAPFMLIQDAAEGMRSHGLGGSIVNILSNCVHGGPVELCAYSSAKGALAVLTKNSAHALRHYGIRVNGINMGWTLTDNEDALQRKLIGENWLEESEQKQPFGRILRPTDIASLTLYLLSDLSSLMTGSLIDYDQHVHGCQ